MTIDVPSDKPADDQGPDSQKVSSLSQISDLRLETFQESGPRQMPVSQQQQTCFGLDNVKQRTQ